jgi:signal peptidase I
LEVMTPERVQARRRARSRRATAIKLLVAAGLGIGLRLWVFEIAIVEGESMEQTLLPGDRVLVVKPVGIKRFDVVVLTDPKGGETVIKRVIGFSGETVSMVPLTKRTGDRDVIVKSGQLYVNNVPYDEPYATIRMPTVIAPWKVGRGKYYVLGDNRDVSIDSRKFGAAPRKNIHGVAYAVIWPPSRVRLIPRSGTREAVAPAPPRSAPAGAGTG